MVRTCNTALIFHPTGDNNAASAPRHRRQHCRQYRLAPHPSWRHRLGIHLLHGALKRASQPSEQHIAITWVTPAI
ncbi:hypothetical protein C9397_13355 [Xanthomonas vasicola pv. vasculorum]|uniref:Uncharacterized protein n=1 Tax=Xanthomonas vasicola pv. vasculorum TaxID=325776 RepID=A0AAE8F9M9_XANVA|nr:hypothetical protein C7V42_08950 [Xanthomonas vasicola pv. vasculorum]AZR26833.1 hypothetical protein NX80_010470 [Xanthomonas vasicola pv. arecae]AZR31384.1 hypothetical protein KWO_013485 [Xanthomonas vasicola pv. musacearum NCPPB 4379]AZR34554.1 hypothetical protein NX08_008740 [Xanthomonas vasicola]RRJ35597.1 hypothetical protein EIM46_21605 [Xanthomonas vasicola pv. musacearum]